jgi:Uma2 family endonuclease
MTTLIGTRRFSVEEYHRMAEVGILKPNDRVELLDGDIIAMAPMSSRHAAAVSKIAEWLQRACGGRALVRVQSPIALDDHSEPEPDLALVRLDATHYAAAHPQALDVHLLIEVAQSSLTFDREVKLPHYARAGVMETWIVNLELQQVEVYRDPGPLGYRMKTVNRRGSSLSPQAFPETAVAIEQMMA